ncbi:MAG: class I SAM-dependent methyltransferase [Idiomarina sp.]|nr:class I SAM-dependent methyltransferase [Idiomarina sp.]
MSAIVVIKQGREKSLLRRHPWIFSGAIHKVKGQPNLGDTVEVRSDKHAFLGWAAWSPHSQIRARVWSFEEHAVIDQAFFVDRIGRAKAMREALVAPNSNAWRVVAAESDGLPGVTIDKYDNWLVCQLLSAGADVMRPLIIAALRELFPDCSIYERSDVDVRNKEGLKPAIGVLHGEAPLEPVVITENGLKLEVDIVKGHKTGYYLDQRDARALIGKYAKGRRVLNCFSYTGGFGIYAAKAGATEVIQMDASQDALAVAKRNAELNGITTPIEYQQADVFEALRTFVKEGQTFDLIVLDPPKFVDSKASLNRACRGYKDINRLASQLLTEGGILMTFSCSGLLSAELFQKVVADGALDANRELQIIEKTQQAIDHPVAIHYPEGGYLKGLVLRA